MLTLFGSQRYLSYLQEKKEPRDRREERASQTDTPRLAQGGPHKIEEEQSRQAEEKWKTVVEQNKRERARQEEERREAEEATKRREERYLADLFAQVQRQIEQKRLTTPKGNNAFETYLEILRIKPDMGEALAGVQRIKGQYIQWAKAAKNYGEWGKVEEYYKRALKVAPQDETLAEALQEVKEEAARELKAAKHLAELFERAKRQVAAQQFLNPKGNNALETYREVLRLRPAHMEAITGIQRIKERYVQWAEVAKSRKEWEKAEKHYESAFEVDPQDIALRVVLEEIQEKEKQEQRLEKAKMQVPTGRSLHPAERTVLDFYEAVNRNDCLTAIKIRPGFPHERCRRISDVSISLVQMQLKMSDFAVVKLRFMYKFDGKRKTSSAFIHLGRAKGESWRIEESTTGDPQDLEPQLGILSPLPPPPLTSPEKILRLPDIRLSPSISDEPATFGSQTILERVWSRQAS